MKMNLDHQDQLPPEVRAMKAGLDMLEDAMFGKKHPHSFTDGQHPEVQDTYFESNEGAIEVPEERRISERRVPKDNPLDGMGPLGIEQRRGADRRHMSIAELRDLETEAGYPMSPQQGHLYRRAKLLSQAVADMLELDRKIDADDQTYDRLRGN